MAKRQRKQKTQAEIDEIEADRIAAAEHTGPYASPEPTPEDVAAYEEQQSEEEAERVEEQEAFEAAIIENVDEERVDPDTGLALEGADDEELEPDPERNSVVKAKFKKKYIENAQALGLTTKAAKRSNWDWLSQMLAAFCLNEKGKIDIGSFKDVLDANGVDHSKWTNQNKGWEGRFRMTGRVALQKVVATSGLLKWPGDLEATPAPADFVERFKTKA